MSKYLVTGGSGFIGSAVVKKLLQMGHEVRVFDNNSRGSFERLSDVIDRCEFVQGDIRDFDATLAALKGVDSVIHLAYVNGTKYFYERPSLVLDVAVRGMINIIDGCKKLGVGELYLASSSEVYQTPPLIPTPEEIPLVIPDVTNARYSYGGGKIFCELWASTMCRNDFDKMVVFRPHNVYGPNMGFEHVVPEIICRAYSLARSRGTGSIAIQGDGRQTRAFIYIDDFVDGVQALIEKGRSMETYNIGTMDEISIGELASKVETLFALGDAGPSPSLGVPCGSTIRRCPDITKISELGFNPVTSLDEGLRKTVEWYASHLSQEN